MYDENASYLPYAYFGDAEDAPESLRFRCMADCARLIRLRDMHAIELIDIDHDAGEFASDGGDYIKLLDWLEETGRNYPIRIHSMNVVGVANMRAIIERNGWKEIR